MMANTHYLVVKHVPFAVSITVLKDFIIPCLMMFPFATVWGFEGVWVGFAFGYVVSCAYPFVFVRLRYGKRNFPWLVPPAGKQILDFSVRLSKESLIAARDRIGDFLRDGGIEPRVARRVMLTVEDSALETLERNRGKAPIAEYAVFLDREGFVRLVTRDTGKEYDVNGAMPYLPAFAKSRYLNTLNCNRSEYFFKTGEKKDEN